MNAKVNSLVEDFQTYFDVEVADTAELLEKTYQIRYRVYCQEFGYEPAESFPDNMERDEFDANSTHCLVTHKSSGMPAGCVRVVHVDDKKQMPMEKYCLPAIEKRELAVFSNSRETICEVSRLAVDGAFRRRTGESASRFGEVNAFDCSAREQRTFSLIAVSTLTAAFAAGDLIGRHNIFCMMEPFLPRLLARSGIKVRQIGEYTDYHGQRAPYFLTTDGAVSGMPLELQNLHEIIHKKFRDSL